MIDVLVPVLRRPQNVRPFIESLRQFSTRLNSIMFLCSQSDTEEIMEVKLNKGNAVMCEWKPGRGDYARKMNYGFALTDSPYVFLAADDISFTKNWDSEVLAVAESSAAGVIATNDCANPSVKRGEFGTHCLVRRSYVDIMGASLEGPGHLLSETYDHNFVDRELCHLADERGLYAFAEKSHVVHMHPHWGTAKMDATYRKGTAQFRQDRRLFLRRMRGLPT